MVPAAALPRATVGGKPTLEWRLTSLAAGFRSDDLFRMNATALIRGLAASAATVLTTLAIPAVAGAADYCVGQNLGCDDPHTVQYLDEALDLADDAADADRVLLGAGTHIPSNGLSFEYLRDDGPVEIVGQGAGKTIITRPAGVLGAVLRLEGGPGSSIHDVTVRVPEKATGTARALDTTGVARDIVVDEHPNQLQQRYGVALFGGGVLENSTVKLSGVANTTAVRLSDGGTVRRSTLSAQTGVYVYGDAAVERSRIAGTNTGVVAYKGDSTIAGSLIFFGDFAGIVAGTVAGEGATVKGDGVTIVGKGLPDTVGAMASTMADTTASVNLTLTNAIIRGASRALTAGTLATATGHATIVTSYSDYDPSANSTKENGSIIESNVSNVGDAGFANAAAGDYHLLASSPLIDAGDPATQQGLDLEGNPLVTDGNHDGTARRDMGAFEVPGSLPAQNPAGGQAGTQPALDTLAPTISGFRVTRTPRATRIRYTLSEPARVTLRVQRAVRGSRTRYRTIGRLTKAGVSGANRTRLRGRLAKRVRVPGRYRVKIVATDAAGNRAAPKTARFRVRAAAGS
jgi:hypothetical protein